MDQEFSKRKVKKDFIRKILERLNFFNYLLLFRVNQDFFFSVFLSHIVCFIEVVLPRNQKKENKLKVRSSVRGTSKAQRDHVSHAISFSSPFVVVSSVDVANSSELPLHPPARLRL